MIKKILKSVLVLALVLATAGTATKAWFTSSVTAADNEIQSGTLLLAVDTAQSETDGRVWGVDAWNVVRELEDGTVDQRGYFIPWTNAAPGEKHSFYVALRNRGTIGMQVRTTVTGEWVEGPRLEECEPDGSLVQVTNVHQFASNNCEGEYGCHNLYYSLTGLGWEHLPGLESHDASPDPDDGYYYGTVGGGGQAEGNHYTMDENQFAVYRFDVELSEEAGNCYQGATYHFDFVGEARQPGGDWPAH